MSQFLRPTIVGGSLALVLLVLAAVYLILCRHVAKPGRDLFRSVIRHTGRPGLTVALLSAAEITAATLDTKVVPFQSGILQGVGIALILAVAWLTVGILTVVEDRVLARYQLDAANNLRARQVRTQVQVLRRIAVVVVALLALGAVLFSFPPVRAAGAGLLASAGVVGILAGIAVTPLATNLVAGLQIALTQPVRVDDVVVINGEWGRVEEIHLTFLVVKVWDLRRLILPITYLTQNPFENWTRSTANILGWVYIEVDYTMPIDTLRQHIGEIIAGSPSWDGQVWNLQVTNLGHEAVQVRVLVSAADSSKSWDLQCEVREKVLAFLQQQYPSALPRVRAEVGWAPGDGTARRGAAVIEKAQR